MAGTAKAYLDLAPIRPVTALNLELNSSTIGDYFAGQRTTLFNRYGGNNVYLLG